jgi:hypothetical protein
MLNFDWYDVPACKYVLQVDNNKDFLSPEIHKSYFIVNSNYTPEEELPKGTYYWRVRAHSEASRPSLWSDVWMLTLMAASTECICDFEPDGDVDGSDLAILAAEFDRTYCINSPAPGKNDNHEGVEVLDLSKFAKDFGRTDCL